MRPATENRRSLRALEWVILVLGVSLNLLALYIMLPEIAKEPWRFSELPREALHISLSSKVIFSALEISFTVYLGSLFERGYGQHASATCSIAIPTWIVLLSPSVGTL